MGGRDSDTGLAVYAGKGTSISLPEGVEYVNESIRRELTLLENSETAQRYLDQYSHGARFAGMLGILPPRIQERYNTARATIRNSNRKGI